MKNIITLLRQIVLTVTLSAMTVIPSDIEYYGMTNVLSEIWSLNAFVAFGKAIIYSNFMIDNFYSSYGLKLLDQIKLVVKKHIK